MRRINKHLTPLRLFCIAIFPRRSATRLESGGLQGGAVFREAQIPVAQRVLVWSAGGHASPQHLRQGQHG